MVLMKRVSQRHHDPVVAEALDRADLASIAGDREGQAGSRRLALDQDRAGAAHPVLAAQMRAGEIASLAQEVGERQPRRHVVDHRLSVHPQADLGHDNPCAKARMVIAVWRLDLKSSNASSWAARSSAIACCQAPESFLPDRASCEVRCMTIGGPATAPSTTRA